MTADAQDLEIVMMRAKPSEQLSGSACLTVGTPIVFVHVSKGSLDKLTVCLVSRLSVTCGHD